LKPEVERAIMAGSSIGRQSLLISTPSTETVGETAYRRIRTDIIFGVLLPGQRLKLEKISESYGTSISTLRELLNRMSSEGLIVAEGQRGFEVAPVSADEFRQVAALRLLLENHAIEQSFAAGDLDWEGRVVSAHHKLAVIERHLLAGSDPDQQLWKRCDWEFHHALISACGSDVLLDTHASIYDRYLRYQMIAVVFRGEIAAREHQGLLECALARDSKRALGIMVSHIEGCVDHALTQDAAGIFNKPSREQPSVRSLNAIAPEASAQPPRKQRSKLVRETGKD
jgi:DNA-binding GntR family transcriptional regulator